MVCGPLFLALAALLVGNATATAPLPRTIKLTTPFGAIPAVGVLNGDAYRFTVKYGSAQRWAASTTSTTWQIPNGLTDPSSTPLACPQDGLDPSEYSEDCLSMIVYVPSNIARLIQDGPRNVPVMMWLHGGSFIQGSASDPATDGSKLAVATNSVVAVTQYRLGGFGWISPNGATNLGVGDAVTALKFVNKVITTFGGSQGQVVLSGQSSGASLIRALLATPSASKLFKSAILQSDPMDYGFYKPAGQATLNNAFASYLGCRSGDSKCLAALSAEDILVAADNTFFDAVLGNLDPSVGGGEPFRPVHDGQLITSPLDTTAPLPKQTKPLLITTVKDDATLTIYGQVDTEPVAPADYQGKVRAAYSEQSTNMLVKSSYYHLPSASQSVADMRPTLATMGTDGIWRCPAWTLARLASKAGAKVYVGEFVVGSSYPGNSDLPQCAAPGAVCHRDDIKILFGTVESPTVAQKTATAEIQARWKAFIHSGNPNAAGYRTWQAVGADNVHAIHLGNGNASPAAVGACIPSFWGAAVPYDYQVYGI